MLGTYLQSDLHALFDWRMVGFPWSLLTLLVQIGAGVMLLALLLWRWRRPIRLGVEFPLILGIVTVLFFSAYFFIRLASGGAGRLATLTTTFVLDQTLDLTASFLTPFVILSGIEGAELGMGLTRAVTSRLTHEASPPNSLRRRAWIIGLAGLFVGRFLVQWIVPLFNKEGLAFSWGAVFISLLFLVIFCADTAPVPFA